MQTSFLLGYIARWRPLAPLGKAWGGGVDRLGWRSMQGHACLTLRNVGGASELRLLWITPMRKPS